MYKHIFGPVPSRRLKMSLGVDIVPHKICSLNCVYCECGKTTNLTVERKEYVPTGEVLAEIDHYLKNNQPPDYITFSGSGEPLLHSGIGEIINYIKNNFPLIPLAILTNGTLLSDKHVRSEILQADVVLPSFDAATEKSFLKINRPSKLINLNEYLQGLIDFRQEFKGQIWLEIFILPNYNDDQDNLKELKKAVKRINPNIVQLNTLDRPCALKNLKPASYEQLDNIITLWNLKNVKIISSVDERKKVGSFRKDTESVILETIARRPCTVSDLSDILGLHDNEINKYLSTLENDKKIARTELSRGTFYSLKVKQRK
ncbi:MAG: radical SAM protein [Candidatus Delongbacteria bacterium]|nr:radical SAM protein [Candidatus Delongbacteria bacterium]MCG2760044.1 radical SAM protein [Candidatus Delongbacteria bacterium]